VAFGPVQRRKALVHLYAMVQHFGQPSSFITISPSDIDSPLLMRIGKHDNTDGFDITLMTSAQRASLAAAHPTAGALYFNRIVEKACKCLLRTSCDASKSEKQTKPLSSKQTGVLEKILAQYMVFEV
jgi:hypothetical protein